MRQRLEWRRAAGPLLGVVTLLTVSTVAGNTASAATPSRSRSAQLHWYNTVVVPLNNKVTVAGYQQVKADMTDKPAVEKSADEALIWAEIDHYLVQAESALARVSAGRASISKKAPIVIAFKRLTADEIQWAAACSKLDADPSNSALVIPCDQTTGDGGGDDAPFWDRAVTKLTHKPTLADLTADACDAIAEITSAYTNYSTPANAVSLSTQVKTFETDGAKSLNVDLVSAAEQAQAATTEAALADAANAAHLACLY